MASLRRRRRRVGLALFVVLQAIGVAGVVVLGAQLRVRSALRQSVALESRVRAGWRGEGCATVLRTIAAEHLADQERRGRHWRELDRLLVAEPRATGVGCEWSLRPAGLTMNVNRLSELELRTLFTASGTPFGRASQVAASISDWIDADTITRAGGAEAAWYAAQGGAEPRNAPVRDIRELLMVKGVDAALLTWLGITDEPLYVRRAPLPILRLLAGVPQALLGRWSDLREAGADIPDLEQMVAGLPQEDRLRLAEHLTTLRSQLVYEPAAWEVEVAVPTSADGRAHLVVTQRWSQAQGRVAIQSERREWR